MSKHTPGPWIARKTGGAGWPGQRGWAIDYNGDQEQVVDFVYEEADAHLIAAAPDLLEALEMMVNHCSRVIAPSWLPEGYEEGLKAIARARGEK